jgi:hypothetical protein
MMPETAKSIAASFNDLMSYAITDSFHSGKHVAVNLRFLNGTFEDGAFSQ